MEPRNNECLELTIPPSASLKSSLLERKPGSETVESPLLREPGDKGTAEPYWLRPTSAQMYPYNFIMALRKKLEQVSYPPMPSAENRIPSPIPAHQTARSPPAHSSPNEASQSEDYSTNFSSATLQTQHTQTSAPVLASEQDGKNGGDASDTQDTLSISSGILSHSSPEKQPKPARAQAAPSPLSTDLLDGLQIASKNSSRISRSASDEAPTSREQISSFINFSRGNAYEKLEPLAVNVGTDRSRRPESFDVQEMLNEFNENLSQAIEVNQRLHSILSNPATQRTNSEPVSLSSRHYSDDFENGEASKSHISQGAFSQSSRTLTQTESRRELPSVRVSKSSSSTRETITEQITQAQGDSASEVKPSKSSQEDATEKITSETIRSSVNEERSSNSVRSIHKRIVGEKEVINSSIGSDIRGVFKRYALEYSADMNSTSWSDGNRSLSSLGMVSQHSRARLRLESQFLARSAIS